MSEHRKYKVHVERVGRNVKNVTWDVETTASDVDSHLDQLAQQIYRLARRHLMSTDVEVNVVGLNDDPLSGSFQVRAGWRDAGSGTWEQVTDGREDQ